MSQAKFPEQWGIRDKRTGFFLPDRRYITALEPREGCWPKLYSSRAGALSALARWAEGKWSYTCTGGGGFWNEDEPDIEWGPTPVAGRERSNMEVVRLRLTQS